MDLVRGKVLKYGDNINTDLISPPQYLEKSLDVIAQHAMEGIDETFTRRLTPGGVIAAGDNFGPGSSRETAPIALKMAGVGAIVAKSFARIFFRNAINIGLPVLECADADKIGEGDELEINLQTGRIKSLATGAVYQASPLSEPVMDVLSAGGLIPFLEKRHGG
jgi:3-isopropylmalate/(R)-2-methylmalate dehydratase small subunit